MGRMVRAARALRSRIPSRGLGLGSAVRRIREIRGIGQEVLQERSGLSQAYLSELESGRKASVTEETLERLAAALEVKVWEILAQAIGLPVETVEPFSDDERIWLDTYRALTPEQRETILRVAMVMRKPRQRASGR